MEKVPRGFSFPLKTIVLAINLVSFGLISLRGTQKAFRCFLPWFQGGVPAHTTIQQWIMRVGLFKLNNPVDKRDDWVYILDHTIEFGAKKCLVILGLTLESFRNNNCVIRHQDVEVLAIQVDYNATADRVTTALQEVSQVTGPPAQIVSDGGSGLKKGIADFILDNTGVRYTYDVTHKAALILKHHLKEDEEWKNFVEYASQTKRSLVHTALAHIAPPKPRDKARWLNLGPYMKWFSKVRNIDKRKLSKKEKEKYKDKLSWVSKFKSKATEWETMLKMVEILAIEVKNNGFRNKTEMAFNDAVDDLEINTTRLKSIRNEIVEYIQNQCIGVEEAIPGCSDIIESVFGKYKSFSGKSPMKAVGKTVLMLPVFTSELKPEEIREAMESVSERDVKRWLDENIGKSLFSKRMQAFNQGQTKKSVKKKPKLLGKCA